MKKAVVNCSLGILLAAGCFFVSGISAEAVEGARTVPYYSLEENGGNWDGEHYYQTDGTMITDSFFFDGKYTYYLQMDGTPMTERLTYHPDGEHVIYFDEAGHEAFNSNEHITTSIEGQPVDDDCYFGVYGYMYTDELAFNKTTPMYYNSCGVREHEGWFQFPSGDYGIATTYGNLVNDSFYYDPFGRVVYCHWNGTVARGLIADDNYYYHMDETDGHLLGYFPKKEGVDALPGFLHVPVTGTTYPQVSTWKVYPYEMRLLGDNVFTNSISDWNGTDSVITYMDSHDSTYGWELDIYKDQNGQIVNSYNGEGGTYMTFRGITIGSTKEEVREAYYELIYISENPSYDGNYDLFQAYCLPTISTIQGATRSYTIRFFYDENDRVRRISYSKNPVAYYIGVNQEILYEYGYRDTELDYVGYLRHAYQHATVEKVKDDEGYTVVDVSKVEGIQEGAEYAWYVHTRLRGHLKIVGGPVYRDNDPSIYAIAAQITNPDKTVIHIDVE